MRGDAWRADGPGLAIGLPGRQDKKTLGVKGSNPYFILTPGYQLSYKNGNDTDTVTVLNETKVIDGVETRVVEDREMKNGQLIELTSDYYAIDSVTNDVYYFGEDVDTYRNGKVTGHEGAWLSGVKGAKFGLMMPGKPKVGQRFYQEQAPGVGGTGPRGDRLRERAGFDSRRDVREMHSHAGDQRAGKEHGRPQVVCGRRGPGERREDAFGEVRQ